jgi:hypothetical protein
MTNFIDKWNTSVVFARNNYREYERYVEQVLTDFFDNDLLSIENILSISADLNSSFEPEIFVTLNADYPDEEYSKISEMISERLMAYLANNSVVDANVFVYNRADGLGSFTYGKFVILAREYNNG